MKKIPICLISQSGGKYKTVMELVQNLPNCRALRKMLTLATLLKFILPKLLKPCLT